MFAASEVNESLSATGDLGDSRVLESNIEFQ